MPQHSDTCSSETNRIFTASTDGRDLIRTAVHVAGAHVIETLDF